MYVLRFLGTSCANLKVAKAWTEVPLRSYTGRAHVPKSNKCLNWDSSPLPTQCILKEPMPMPHKSSQWMPELSKSIKGLNWDPSALLPTFPKKGDTLKSKSSKCLNWDSSALIRCKESSIYVILEKKLRGLSPNFHIHVYVNDLYIPRAVSLFYCSRIGRPIEGIQYINRTQKHKCRN